MNAAKIAFDHLREQIIDEHNRLDLPITMAQATVIALAQMLDEECWDERLLFGANYDIVGFEVDGARLLIDGQ